MVFMPSIKASSFATSKPITAATPPAASISALIASAASGRER